MSNVLYLAEATSAWVRRLDPQCKFLKSGATPSVLNPLFRCSRHEAPGRAMERSPCGLWSTAPWNIPEASIYQ